MWENILEQAATNGLWALLSCVLLIYELKDSRRRESKYNNTIDSLCDRLGALNTVVKVQKTIAQTVETTAQTVEEVSQSFKDSQASEKEIRKIAKNIDTIAQTVETAAQTVEEVSQSFKDSQASEKEIKKIAKDVDAIAQTVETTARSVDVSELAADNGGKDKAKENKVRRIGTVSKATTRVRPIVETEGAK